MVGQRGQAIKTPSASRAFGVEPLGDLVRRVHRQVGELGVFAHAVTGDLQDFEAALFKMALEPLIDLIFIGGADDELLRISWL